MFTAFDTLEEATHFIDKIYLDAFKTYNHHHYCVTYCPKIILTPEGYTYYRANYLSSNAKPGEKDILIKTTATFLKYSAEKPTGKYYVQDNMDNLLGLYGSENKYYAYNSLEEALFDLGITYSSEIPKEWVSHEWIEEVKRRKYRNPPPIKFINPFKLYHDDNIQDLSHWVFGRRVVTLFGPNRKEIVNFGARSGYGNNCQLFVGTEYPIFSNFFEVVIKNKAPLGEGIPYCNYYGGSNGHDYD